MMDCAAGSTAEVIRYPWADAPEEGTLREVAPGIFWLRLPLPMALDHVNLYVLDDGDGWTVVDAGLDTRRARAIWESVLAGPLSGKPLRRVVVTHYHPDHVGLAGWLQAMGAELVTTRTSWLTARMLVLDVQPVPVQNGVQALDELIAGSLDATIFSVSAGKTAQADAAIGVRFLDFPVNDETKAAMAKMAPGATVAKVDLGRKEAGQQGNSIIQAPFVILVTNEVDEQTVYDVVSSIAANIERIAKADPQFANLTVEIMAQPSLPIPYHPGAIRFFEEQGVWK